MTDVKDASHAFRDRFNWEILPEKLKSALCVPTVSNSEIFNALLDEICASNHHIHENNQQVVDGYNRAVFKYLQTVYALESEDGTSIASGVMAEMSQAKAKADERIQAPSISAAQLHDLKVICPQTAMKALSCFDNSFQSIQLGEVKRKPQRICRVYPIADMTTSKSNALLSVFPDKKILEQAMRKLLSEGFYFMLSPSQALSLPIFTVPSQTPKRAKHADRRHGLSSDDHYICLGGYYCTCDAFFNQVLTGPPLSFEWNSRGAPAENVGKVSHLHSQRRELYCKHSLASQLVLACESNAELAHFDVNCFIASCLELFRESSDFYRIAPAMSFYSDCVFASEECYYNLVRMNL